MASGKIMSVCSYASDTNKESQVTLSHLSGIHSIYFFFAKSASSRSVFYVIKNKSLYGYIKNIRKDFYLIYKYISTLFPYITN